MNRLIAASVIALLGSVLPATTLADTRSAKVAESKQTLLPITLNLFLHDELSKKEIGDLWPSYLSWFSEELTHITGRQVQITWITKQAGLTDFNYRLGNEEKSLLEWNNRLVVSDVYRKLSGSKRDKFLLITRDKVSDSAAGVAYEGRSVAIASLASYRIIAHETGHLLGASHKQGTFQSHGLTLPCLSTMFEPDYWYAEHCYKFSEQSAEAIRQHLKGTP